ncbi:hypothetical protein QA612_00110 [Evansella sp. AB-P1]|nr:hypothetical protein [Evansella sp. AB-P1]MDG5785875.1 hypothetical protein [Evansella sp. AB-P1]
MLYSQELYEAGHVLKVIFNGAVTVWAKNFEDPESKFHPITMQ